MCNACCQFINKYLCHFIYKTKWNSWNQWEKTMGRDIDFVCHWCRVCTQLKSSDFPKLISIKNIQIIWRFDFGCGRYMAIVWYNIQMGHILAIKFPFWCCCFIFRARVHFIWYVCMCACACLISFAIHQ